jgi:hypothetical protein
MILGASVLISVRESGLCPSCCPFRGLVLEVSGENVFAGARCLWTPVWAG